MKKFYVAVAEVYQEVERATPRVEGNPCGTCRSCCSGGMNHKVSELELATMTYHLGEERVASFRSYLAKEKDEKGDLLFPVCPNLDEQGCTVHEVRPLSCRLYGHFRAESQPLFEHCVFRGKETVFPDKSERHLTPGAARLSALSIEYQSYFPYTAGHREVTITDDWQTPLEQASYLSVTGDAEGARTILRQLRRTEPTPIVLLMLAECEERLGDYPAALSVLEEAVALSPDNPELHLRRGSVFLWSGRLQEARDALDHCLSLAPDRALGHGLLGFVLNLMGDHAAAEPHLREAVEKETEPGPYRLQLALALQALGKAEACQVMLERAREYEPTRLQAEQALAESRRGRSG